MTENQKLPQNPGPDPANLFRTPTTYEQALQDAIEEAHADLDEQVGFPSLSEELSICEDDEEVKEAYEFYPEGLKTHAAGVERVLAEWDRKIPQVLGANESDWEAYDAFSFRIGEQGFDCDDPFEAIEGASSVEAGQAIRMTQDHMVLSEAQGYLEHELPSPDEFAAFVADNASSPKVADAIRSALDWDIWELLPKNEHGQVFSEEEKQARASLLLYVSNPDARKDMETALEHYELEVRREQDDIHEAVDTKLGAAALHDAIKPQLDGDPRQN